MHAAPALPMPLTPTADHPSRPPIGSSTLTWTVTILGCVGCAVTWPTLLIMMYFIVPKFWDIYKDFGTQLSPTSRWFCDASVWVRGDLPGQIFPGWIGVLLIGTIVTIGTLLLALSVKTRPLAALVLLLGAIVGIVGFLTFFVSMNTPLVAMIQQLQGAPAQGP